MQDEHIIVMESSPPPGVYRFAVGMYRLADGQRLPVLSADGQPVDTRVVLDEGWVIE